MLIANALTIFVLEAQLPPIVPIPGVKLGLANVVTLFAVYLLGCRETVRIQIIRIVLGSIFTGQIVSFLYSLSGGVCSLLVLLCCSKLLSREMIWLAGIFSAVAHIIGQLAIAVPILGSIAVLYYAPIVFFTSILTGCFTGLCVQFLFKKHNILFRCLLHN